MSDSIGFYFGGGGGTSIPNASKRMNEMIAMMRIYFRDTAELNRLIAGEETSDRMFAWAIIDALDDYNATPPFIGNATLMNFPSVSLLRLGATINVLESIAFLQMRNMLRFNDSGLSVSVSDRAPMLLNWVQLLENRYERNKMRLKASINIEKGMEGIGVFSEYFIINGVFLSTF